MRIVSGTARGRRLAVPPGRTTRPTSDRAREALFSTVESILGSLAGRRVLDLYAGSGAVGLEAASRGAGDVLLVEHDPRAVRTIRVNVAAVGCPGVRLRQATVERTAVEPPDRPYDLVFADPPYSVSDDALQGVLVELRKHGWLADDALVVVERATRGGQFHWPEGYRAERSRRYGETTLWYGRPDDSQAGRP